MIALLFSCSLSWCQISIDDPDDYDIPFTGVVEQTDSVLIPIGALKIANAKMVELEYEKEINSELRNIIENDSILINDLSSNLDACEINANNKVNKIKRQRNILGITSGSLIILLIISIL